MSGAEPLEEAVAHRPFPMPKTPWVMFQSWRKLLFAHWRVDVQALRPLIPRELELDLFDGHAWIGLTPFRLTDLRPRFLPAAPGLSDFPEMNLRTYVRAGETPGIFFFSLDAGSTLAVLGARLGFRLPYFPARMSISEREGWVHFRSRRRGGSVAEFVGRYRPVGEVCEAERGTVEYFLVERYALFTVPSRGRVLRGDIHHRPWPLQVADVEIETNTVPTAHGLDLRDPPALVHYAHRQDTQIWPPKFAL